MHHWIACLKKRIRQKTLRKPTSRLRNLPSYSARRSASSNATRTPLERYNKEMEMLNKLLKAGHINQETFGRAMEQAQEKLKKSSEKMGDVIEGEFEGLGKTMEGTHGRCARWH